MMCGAESRCHPRADCYAGLVPIAKKLKLTYAAYALREDEGDVKHEFVDGEVFAMAGGTPEHAAIVTAVAIHLGSQLLGGPCRAFATELRTRIRADEKGPDVGTYPDIAVLCGPAVRDPEDPNSVVNPTLIVEVLSHSTEAYDRHGKFEHYKRLDALLEYVLVSQHEPRIERFEKRAGIWSQADVAGVGGRIVLTSASATLAADAIYAGLIGEDGHIRLA
jgi:Uma2 family endonuclease